MIKRYHSFLHISSLIVWYTDIVQTAQIIVIIFGVNMKRIFRYNVVFLLALALLLSACGLVPATEPKVDHTPASSPTAATIGQVEEDETSRAGDPSEFAQLEAESEFIVYFLDVGQADATFIYSDGYTMLIDGGGASSSNANRQLIAMNELSEPPAKIFVDKQSGKDFNRPRYKAMLDVLNPGDLVYLMSIDRLGRNYEEIQKQWRILTKEIEVDIAVIDMPLLDTRNGKDLMGTFIADLILQLLSFLAHIEHDTIRKRQTEGIAAARKRGIHMGRPVKRPPENFLELAKEWVYGKITKTELMQRTGFSESTLYRRLREDGIVKKK